MPMMLASCPRKRKIREKDLIFGATYLDNYNMILVYLGKFDYYHLGLLYRSYFFKNRDEIMDYVEKFHIDDFSFDDCKVEQRKMGKAYYFSAFQYPQIHVSDTHAFTNLSKIVSLNSCEIVPDLKERLENLEYCCAYSPFDFSKDQYLQIPFDSFRDSLHVFRRKNFLIMDGEDIIPVRVEPVRNDVRYNLFSTQRGRLVTRFGLDLYENPINRKPLYIGELYETYKFVELHHYLANGKPYLDVIDPMQLLTGVVI